MNIIDQYYADNNYVKNEDGPLYIIEGERVSDNQEYRFLIFDLKIDLNGNITLFYNVERKDVNNWAKFGQTYQTKASNGEYVDPSGNEVAKAEAFDIIGEDENGNPILELKEGYSTSFAYIWDKMDFSGLASLGTGLKRLLFPVGAEYVQRHFTNKVEPYL